MANKYWSCHDILQIVAQYYILLGPRGTGKSYSVTKHILEQAYRDSEYQFGYLRRYEMDTKNDAVTSYFAEMDIEAITGGEYNAIRSVRGWIYFAKVNEEDEHDVTYSRKIGKSFALASAEHYKSLKYPNIVDIIFEEFITDSLYLQNEPSKLQELVSTILRDRSGHVWLIGNTLSRVCPYFSEWGLDCCRDMKGGEIKEIEVHGKDNKDNDYTTKIAVEICVAEKSATGMFFGQRGKSITGAQVWTGDRHARIQGHPRFDYELLYEFELIEFAFHFIVQLLCEPETGNLFIYIYPRGNSDRVIDRIIQSEFSTDWLTTNCLNVTIKAEKVMKELFKLNKYCFSDDRTGDDFEHVLQNRKGVL